MRLVGRSATATLTRARGRALLRAMRISAVDTLVVGTPWRNLSVVRVKTDEGLEGLGEVRMVGHTDALLGYLTEGVPRHVLGADPFRTDDLVRRLMRDDYARMGEIAMSGIAALEMACYDIKGKALGVPVYELLGGAVRDRIPAYANGWYTVERTADEFAAAARKVVERGYRALKLDPFGPGFYELSRAEFAKSIELVEAVRGAIGPDVQLLIEMHGRFTPAEAVRICRALERFDPGWVEEPVPPENLKALKKASEGIKIPVATGERIHTRYDFRELFELQAADIVQPDVTHFGGLGETKKLAAWAEAYYVMLAPHNVGGPISTAANLHLVATCQNFKIQEHFNDFADAWVKQMAPGLPEMDAADGCFPLPKGPGLGVTLDPAFCEAHPAQKVDFNLFRENWHRRDARVTDAR
jgi:galactonate dehydratase